MKRNSPTGSVSINRRNVLRYAGAGIGVTLAGCGGSPDEGSTPTGAESGTGVGTTSLQGETIKIGVLAPSPDSNVFGRSMVNGATLAATEIQDAGGILGADVELVIGDTQMDPSKARQEYRKQVIQENVDLSVGPAFSSTLLGYFKSIAKHKSLNFTGGALGPRVPGLIKDNYESFKYYFQPSPPNLSQLARGEVDLVVNAASRLGWDTVALIDEDQLAANSYRKIVIAGLEDAGFELPVKKHVVGVTNWTPIFDEIENAGADLVLAHQTVIGRTMIKQWADQQRNFELGGLHALGIVPSWYEELNGAPRYTWSMNLVTPKSGNTPHSVPFMDAYFENFGEYPAHPGPTAYDSINIFAHAVRETGSTDEEVLIPYLENDLVFEDSVLMSRVEIQGPQDEKPHVPEYTTMEEMGIPVFHQWQQGDPPDGTGRMRIFYPPTENLEHYETPHWFG